MRVRLKGINRVKKRLASGEEVTYHYAWKGGPPLKGEPELSRVPRQLRCGTRRREAIAEEEDASVADRRVCGLL